MFISVRKIVVSAKTSFSLHHEYVEHYKFLFYGVYFKNNIYVFVVRKLNNLEQFLTTFGKTT